MPTELARAFLREPKSLRPQTNCYTVSVSTNHLRTRKLTILAKSAEEAAITAPDYLTYREGEKACRVNPKLEVVLVPLP